MEEGEEIPANMAPVVGVSAQMWTGDGAQRTVEPAEKSAMFTIHICTALILLTGIFFIAVGQSFLKNEDVETWRGVSTILATISGGFMVSSYGFLLWDFTHTRLPIVISVGQLFAILAQMVGEILLSTRRDASDGLFTFALASNGFVLLTTVLALFSLHVWRPELFPPCR